MIFEQPPHTNMNTEKQAHSAQDMYYDEVSLFAHKNWPDFRESWFMKGQEGPRVVTSMATAGNKLNQPYELAGSMSPAWGQPYDTSADLGGVSIQDLNLMPGDLNPLKETEPDRHQRVMEARKSAARNRMTRFFESIGGHEFAADVVVIKPQSDHYNDRTVKGDIVSADDLERTGEYIEDTRPAFMIYSRDQNRVVAIRPADCPTIAFYGHDRHGKPIHGLIHAGWQDEDAGFVEQGIDFLKNEQDVDMKDLTFTIGPGGVDFGYSRPFDPREGQDPRVVHPGWKTRTSDHVQQDDGKWRFNFDMPGFAADRLMEAGASSEQIFIDSSDTSTAESGHASHKQASRGVKPPMRDIVTVASPERER